MALNINLIERAETLEDIKLQMLELLEQARDAVRATGAETQANAYWLAHIRTALDAEHHFIGSSMCTMQDSIDLLTDDEATCECGYDYCQNCG
ncbi:MAG: hypothetical protein CMB99_01010 [Flavobacteriaceae bacterium]|nr:hypothetical protein [Flavobacteriaceae bacterium]|tara:strand:+ start:354 stop:632 length:279 start_codon:yes stop_codon:yes gene_type:complete